MFLGSSISLEVTRNVNAVDLQKIGYNRLGVPLRKFFWIRSAESCSSLRVIRSLEYIIAENSMLLLLRSQHNRSFAQGF
ncbi:hypothetical protein LEP1GSC168_1609 [Leptospira santarosai str. HAI134]|nr:hypothetical protein LEP1GSC169_0603 [Leptospira santarosai str. HAI1349]EMO22502.1 hypothetical protein LEP1GSC168_1609 [Leptospira santarosai str. HAI134]